MSYEYNSPEAHLLIISESRGEEAVILTTADKATATGLTIPNADVPTVAAELLKAAGQEGVIIPKAYEEVERKGGEITCGSGPEQAYGAVSWNPNWLYNKAANYVALAQYIESTAAREAAEKAKAEAAEKKLQERRDAVAREFGYLDFFCAPTEFQGAVNRIIELEDGASRD